MGRGMICALWALAALAGAFTAHACNSFVFKDPCTGFTVSGASFSETWDLAIGVMVLAPGATAPALEAAPGVKGALNGTITAKYGFVCLGHDLFEVTAATNVTRDFSHTPKDFRLCNQGMNEKGLVVSLQANHDPSRIGVYNTSDPRVPINFWDLTNAILAYYSTVAEVKVAFSKYQIVYNPETFIHGAKPDDPPVWLVMYDATGAGAIIQFKPGYAEVVDNPVGVAGNDPGFIEDHLKWYEGNATAQGLTLDPATKLINGPFWTYDVESRLGPGPDTFKGAFSIPGGFNGHARYMRLAYLKSIATLQKCGPNPQMSPTSSMRVEKGYPPALHSLMAADAMLRSVSLPPGVTDYGTAVTKLTGSHSYEVDTTFTWQLRDLTNMVFYYRTANNFMWRQFDFAKVKWKRYGKKLRWARLAGVPKNVGFVDVTSTLSSEAKEIKPPK